MSDNKILQAIVNGQVAIREDIQKLDKKVSSVEENLTRRINNLGLQLANLEDDAPTRDEFDALGQKVAVLEKHAPQNTRAFY